MMIGRHYDRENYNCAHFVADWFKSRLGIEIPTGNVWELSFAIWLRKHFTEISKPEENCIVLMDLHSGSRHIGVYYNFGVYHNYQAGFAYGSVVHWSTGQIKRTYKKVTYWKWSQ